MDPEEEIAEVSVESEEGSTVARRDLLIQNQLPGVDMEVTEADLMDSEFRGGFGDGFGGIGG